MPNKSSKNQRKTIRIDKKQFAFMMFLTPAFAAIVSVVLVLAIFMPFQPTKSNNSPLEVPTLGGEVEESTEAAKPEEKVTEEVSEDIPVETVVTTEIPAMNTKIIENKKPASTTSTKTTKTTTKSTTTTSTNSSSTSTSTKTSTNTSTETKPSTPSEKEICEAKLETSKKLIRVKLLGSGDIEMFSEWFEDPYAMVYEYTVRDGAHMVWKNNTCTHTEEIDFQDRDILTKEELEAKGYEANKEYWQ